MNNTTKAALALSLILSACVDVSVTDYEDGALSDTGDTGDSYGDGDGDATDACYGATFTHMCIDDGTCWARRDGWSAWAEFAEPGALGMAIDVFKTLVPAPGMSASGECYSVLGADVHVCVDTLDCVALLGRPVAEVLLLEQACAAAGPWDVTAATSDGRCWAIVGDIAVQLSDAP